MNLYDLTLYLKLFALCIKQQMKQQPIDTEDSRDASVPSESVSAPTAFSHTHRSMTRSRTRSRSRSQSSSSSSSSAVAEADMEGFDFEESINSKRRELLADAASLVESAKTVAEAAASLTKSEKSEGENSLAGKKPFMNGIDMFAEELHIEPENYSVSTLSFRFPLNCYG